MADLASAREAQEDLARNLEQVAHLLRGEHHAASFVDCLGVGHLALPARNTAHSFSGFTERQPGDLGFVGQRIRAGRPNPDPDLAVLSADSGGPKTARPKICGRLPGPARTESVHYAPAFAGVASGCHEVRRGIARRPEEVALEGGHRLALESNEDRSRGWVADARGINRGEPHRDLAPGECDLLALAAVRGNRGRHDQGCPGLPQQALPLARPVDADRCANWPNEHRTASRVRVDRSSGNVDRTEHPLPPHVCADYNLNIPVWDTTFAGVGDTYPGSVSRRTF